MALPRSPRTSKQEQINIRVTEFQRRLLEHAADIQGKNRTEFIVSAAIREAQSTLDEQTTLFVDDETFEAFEHALNEHVPSTGVLKQLFTSKAPWE